jgi:archaeosortase B (VPXXXP-CTERM-specific)
MKKSNASVVEVFKNNKDIILWIVFGVMFAIILQIVTHFNSGTNDGFLNPIQKALTYATAYPLVGFLKVIGVKAAIETTFLNTINSMFIVFGPPNAITYRFEIIYECTGIYAWIVYSAAVLAFPTSIKNRLIGFGLGIPAIYVINLIRFICLGLIGAFWPAAFEFAHAYLWQIIIIGFVILMFWGYLSWIVKGTSPLTSKKA